MKFKYIIITEFFDVYGTNNKELAQGQTEFSMVIDVESGEQLVYSQEAPFAAQRIEIEETKA